MEIGAESVINQKHTMDVVFGGLVDIPNSSFFYAKPSYLRRGS